MCRRSLGLHEGLQALYSGATKFTQGEWAAVGVCCCTYALVYAHTHAMGAWRSDSSAKLVLHVDGCADVGGDSIGVDLAAAMSSIEDGDVDGVSDGQSAVDVMIRGQSQVGAGIALVLSSQCGSVQVCGLHNSCLFVLID